MATMQQTLRPSNITQIRNILNLMSENAATNISLGTATNYLPYIVNFDEIEIIAQQLPGESRLINGSWFFVHNVEETEEMVRLVFRLPVEAIEEYFEENEETM